MGVLPYIARRLFLSIGLVLGVSAVIFSLINAIGDPVHILLAERPGINGQAAEAMSRYYGLDQPVFSRYLAWLWGVLRFDFGTSVMHNQPVADMLWTSGWETLKIQIPAVIISLVVATLMGMIAATRQYSRVDFGVMTTALLGQSLPGFFVGIVLILVFSYWLGVLPSYGAYSTRTPLWSSALADALWHMVLPVAMLAYFNTATLTLLIRSNLVDTLRNDFIMAARASGLPEHRVVYRHALRNAFIPVLTYLGILVGLMLGTSPVTETVFTWPGIGRLYVSAIQQLDYPVIMGVSTVITVMIVAANLLTDIAYVLVDPRIRLD
jgi:ABC-type dipeptide/oligopeptide/nickel transport system permease component